MLNFFLASPSAPSPQTAVIYSKVEGAVGRCCEFCEGWRGNKSQRSSFPPEIQIIGCFAVHPTEHLLR